MNRGLVFVVVLLLIVVGIGTFLYLRRGSRTRRSAPVAAAPNYEQAALVAHLTSAAELMDELDLPNVPSEYGPDIQGYLDWHTAEHQTFPLLPVPELEGRASLGDGLLGRIMAANTDHEPMPFLPEQLRERIETHLERRPQ